MAKMCGKILKLRERMKRSGALSSGRFPDIVTKEGEVRRKEEPETL